MTLLRHLAVAFLTAVSLLVLTGCGGAGRDFVRPSPDAVKLGETSYSQVLKQMGEPKTVGEVQRNGKNVKTAIYSYANVNGEPFEEGVNSYRGMTYFFSEDKLVGWQFTSSFKSDNTNFDETKVASIKKGESTRTDVIQLLGHPTALFIPPMVKETSGEALGYTYQAIRGGLLSGLKMNIKALRVSFDSAAVVSDIEFTSSGTK